MTEKSLPPLKKVSSTTEETLQSLSIEDYIRWLEWESDHHDSDVMAQVSGTTEVAPDHDR